MNRLLRFFISVFLPICIAALAAFLFKSVYETPEGINFLLMWICVGLPFGIHRMCVLLWFTRFAKEVYKLSLAAKKQDIAD